MAVIIEYIGKGRMRVIETATERRVREHANALIMAEIKERSVPLIGSVGMEPVSPEWYQCGFYSDLKCWKNQRHARKNWMRHPHRLDNQSSARVLAGRSIYPKINSF